MISLIIPCYNEQDALPIFHSETTKVMNGMGCEYELLFIIYSMTVFVKSLDWHSHGI